MRAAPGEERLHLRAAWQEVTGARKGRVLALVALVAAMMAALVYGIATAGRGPRQEATVVADVAPGSGGEWLSQIPDQPRGRVPEPVPSPAQTPPLATPNSQPPGANSPPAAVNPPALTGGPATGAKPLTPEEQYRLEVEKKRREALLAAYVAPPVAGMTAHPGGAPARPCRQGNRPRSIPAGCRA